MRVVLGILLFFGLACGPAASATLDFSVFPKGETSTVLKFPEVATIESVDGALFVYGKGDFGMPDTGGVCALQPDFSCTGGLSLLFIGPISNLSFKGFFAATSDAAIISAYSGDVFLGLQLVTGNANGSVDIDFSRIPGITRIDIASTLSTAGKGIAYGDFDFDIDPTGTVPPAPLPEEVLNFDSLAGGKNGPTIDIGIATATETSGGNIFVYKSGDFSIPQNGGLCALTADFRCMGDFVIEFDVSIFDLMFSAFFAKPTDSMIVSLFLNGLPVYSSQFWGNSAGTILFDFRSLGVVDKVLIEDRSDVLTKGAAYGDFRYRVFVAPPPAPVPLPASMILLALALGCLGLRARGRRLPIQAG